jgi:hypothetical protein
MGLLAVGVTARKRLVIAFRERRGCHVRLEFSGHETFGSVTIANQYPLARSQLCKTEPAQGFHMYEDVLSASTSSQKSVTSDLIKPFDFSGLKVTFRCDLDMSSLW